MAAAGCEEKGGGLGFECDYFDDGDEDDGVNGGDRRRQRVAGSLEVAAEISSNPREREMGEERVWCY